MVLIPNAFAAYQFRMTHGVLFYSNAFDEPTYLSYDGALAARSVTRLSEYLVLALHQAGVSGGFINVVFDIVFPLAIVVLLRLTLLELGFGELESAVYSVAFVSMPVLFGYSNPYYVKLFDLNYHSGSLSWITLPQAYYPPIFRTPEPQFSLTIAAFATYVGIRWKSFVLPVLVLPVLYPFVGIPYAFIVLSWLVFTWLEGSVRSSAWRLLFAMTAASLTIAAGVSAYYRVAVSGTSVASYLPLTRLPLVSGTGAAALLCYCLFKKRLPAAFRIPALLLAVAPFFAVNTQLFSGFIQTPHSFEQNFGVLALAAVLLLTLRATVRSAWMPFVVAGVSCCLLTQYAAHVFAVNASMWQRLPPSPELLSSLRETPEMVVINDPDLADIYGLVAPGLHFSALARSQTALFEPLLTQNRFENYLCVKDRVSRGPLVSAVPPEVFATLDRSFRYMNQDFPLTHLNRAHEFKVYFDPSQPPAHCNARQLKVFPAFDLGDEVAAGRLPGRLTVVNGSTLQRQPLEVVTARAQWAYAAVAELTELVRARGSRLAMVRTDATVTRGCVGFGVLQPDQRAFANEVLVGASPDRSRVDVTFPPSDRPHTFVVRNCSAVGESAVAIRGIQAFPVKGVTVDTVDVSADGPEKQ